MKKINFKNHWIVKAGVILILVAFISSCETWIDTEMNVDPDAPGDVPMNLLMPGIQQTMGFSLQGNNTVRTVNMWVQILDGVSRQSHTEGKYTHTPADVNNLWGNIYTEMLVNAKILADKAVEQGSPHNEAVANILTAYTLGIATDLFGDIPYSEALRGTEGVLKASFDTQQEIYATLMGLLDDAVTLLGEEEPVGIDGDVIYGGSAGAWINAARAIKARAELQLSKRNGATAYTNALALTDAFSSNDDDMEVPWETANTNPIYQFMVDRGDIRMSQTLLDELEANNDPRIPFYYGEDPDGGITGSIPGSENEDASPPGDHIAANTAPSVLMSYAELKFIEAEAALQTGNASRAATAYQEAVTASVTKVTGAAPDSAFTADVITSVTAGNITLEDIIMQKRHALVGQVQAYSDWRRTGIPTLELVIGATKTGIPRRFPYAQDETIYNPDNIPEVANTLVPVWWDE